MEHIPIILSTVTIILTLIVTVLKGGMYIRDKVSEVTKSFYAAIKDHEEIDTDRHKENVDRLTKLEVGQERIETKLNFTRFNTHDR